MAVLKKHKQQLIQFMNTFCSNHNIPPNIKFYILGGSALKTVLGVSVHGGDIDLYFDTHVDYDNMCKHLSNQSIDSLKSSPNASNYKFDNYIVQCVNRIFGTPQQIFDTFDLNKSCIGVSSDNICYEHEFYKDMYVKNLNYESLIRTYKYGLRLNNMHCFNQLFYKIYNDNDRTIKIEEYYKGEVRVINSEDLLLTFVDTMLTSDEYDFDFDKYFPVNYDNYEILKSSRFDNNHYKYDLPAIIGILQSKNIHDILIPVSNVSSEVNEDVYNRIYTHYPEWLL